MEHAAEGGRWTRQDSIAVVLLIAAFAVAVALVDPRGNFPLDDDWDFALTTWTFLHTGTIQYSPFTSATTHLQMLWGAAWSAAFGETFTVLRLSIMSLSLGAALLLYTLLRRGNATPALAWFGAASLLFHPLFFWASATYMTHVPFVFASIAAAWLFARAVRGGSALWITAAAFAAVASCFTRQFGALNIVTPLVLAISFRDRLSTRWRLIAAVYAAGTALFVVLIAGTGTLIASRTELSVHTPFGGDPRIRLLLAAHHLFLNWQNLALFFAPALLLVLLNRRRSVSPATAVCALIFFGLVAARMIGNGLLIPYRHGHVFVNLGLGPHTLRDVAVLRMTYPYRLSEPFRIGLMIVTAACAAVAIGLVVRALRPPGEDESRNMLIRYAAVYVLCGAAAIVGMRVFFDRYTIDTGWPLALLLPLLAAEYRPRRATRLAASALLLAFALLAVSATAEYLAWNRARWDAFRYLRANGIALEQMDAGYEINAMLAVRAGRSALGKRGFGVADDRFIITFNDVPGYTTIRAFSYPRWLGLKRGNVLVLRRDAA